MFLLRPGRTELRSQHCQFHRGSRPLNILRTSVFCPCPARRCWPGGGTSSIFSWFRGMPMSTTRPSAFRLLGRVLEAAGYRVGILAQPDWKNPEAFRTMGRPRLFAAVSGGAMDSMVNHYTAARKIRRNDAYTPGGRAGARPNRAVIAYTSALKGAFKGVARPHRRYRGQPATAGPLRLLGRQGAPFHPAWTARPTCSIFGMGESPLLEITRRAAAGEPLFGMREIRGTAFVAGEAPAKGVILPPFERVAEDTGAYNEAFRLAARETSPFSGRPLLQGHGSRWVVVNPPALPLTEQKSIGSTRSPSRNFLIPPTANRFRPTSRSGFPSPPTEAASAVALSAPLPITRASSSSPAPRHRSCRRSTD